MSGIIRLGTTSNLLLLGMPEEWGWRSWPFRRETLSARSYLERIGARMSAVLFVESGVVSNLESGDMRDPIEVGVIGREGMIGTSEVVDLPPQRESYVQIEGFALALDARVFQEALSKAPPLRHYFGRYLQTLLVQISLAASASARANVQQRLARKLLMYHDRIGCDEMPLTHEGISLMLGVRRASVTHALHNLEADRLIRARRKLITIRDRAGLERHCGRFYGVAEARYAQIMGFAGAPADRVPPPGLAENGSGDVTGRIALVPSATHASFPGPAPGPALP